MISEDGMDGGFAVDMNSPYSRYAQSAEVDCVRGLALGAMYRTRLAGKSCKAGGSSRSFTTRDTKGHEGKALRSRVLAGVSSLLRC